MKCYDPQGNEHNKESVDVRECMESCGYTLDKQSNPMVQHTVEIATMVEAEPEKKAEVPKVVNAPQIKRGRPARKG